MTEQSLHARAEHADRQRASADYASTHAPRRTAARPTALSTRMRTAISRVARLRFFVADILATYRYMRWPDEASGYTELSARLLFHYHKLEKGLCMPGKARFFGLVPLQDTCELIEQWRTAGYSLQDPVYLGALETIRAYERRLATTPPPAESVSRTRELLSCALADAPSDDRLQTPLAYAPSAYDRQQFHALSLLRRSVREFAPRQVPQDDIAAAIETASLAPSACNRQPWRVHLYDRREQIDRMLALQNGNAGFGHLVPSLLVLTIDRVAYFGPLERNQPYVDGALFAMSLLLALQSRGIASCCLNWCVKPAEDQAAHALGDIPPSEAIVMYLAVGYPVDDARVPRSARRPPSAVLRHHG